MHNAKRFPYRRTGVTPRLLALAISLAAGSNAFAADQTVGSSSSGANSAKSDDLQEIVVTGSLIPQSKSETFTPVSVISAEDIQVKGFTSVADALQHASFSTGAVEGPQYNGGFTPGAQTLSLFGLSPSYTKYQIDGRPIADYPALYN